jgi:type IV pilus assembly protein PilE
VPNRNAFERGFTIVELLVVVSILAVLAALAMPSWRATTNDALIQQARLVLQRLAMRQHRFFRGHGRYAAEQELPALAALGSTVSQRYELQVESDSSGYLISLIDPDGELPTLALNHLGQWASVAGAPP